MKAILLVLVLPIIFVSILVGIGKYSYPEPIYVECQYGYWDHLSGELLFEENWLYMISWFLNWEFAPRSYIGKNWCARIGNKSDYMRRYREKNIP